MLRITQQVSADAAKQYFATADYYTEGQELIGRWGGEGAKLLGLEGAVSGRAFNRLCDNLHPTAGRRLTPRTKDDRTVGYDFTWSVPKSVSLLYAMTEDAAILEAFRESVRETMSDIEAEMKTRVRKGGRNAEKITGNIVYGEFVHFTSRPVDGLPDPQLHCHTFVLNATHDAEEGWKAGQFRDLKRDAPYWQAAFRVRLANRIQELGYAIERKRDDFELAGVPASAIRRFSRRTAKIEELAKDWGITDPDEKALLGGKTRERKNKDLAWQELRQEWNGRLTPREKEGLQEVRARRGTHALPQRTDAAAMDFAIAHVFAKEEVVLEKKPLAEALKHGLGSVTVEGIRREYARVPVLREEFRGKTVATMPHVLAEDEQIIAFGRDGRGTCRPLGVPGRPLKREWLNTDQRHAVDHILASHDRLMLIRGAAGTGKTTMMQEAVEAIEDGGHAVTVLAPSSTAARDVLREHFREADTVAMFLRSEPMQRNAAGQVIWVDEASLLSNESMTALLDVAEKVNARVVLMGDTRQHLAPARGNPLKLLEQEAGVPCVTINEIVRQEGAYKKAVQLLSEGKVVAGFDALDRLGWIHEVSDKNRYVRLAEAYLSAAAEKKRNGVYKTALVETPTHAEAEQITAVIRRELAARGQLGDLRKTEKGKPPSREFVEHEYRAWLPQHLTEAERREASSYQHGDMLQFHQHAPGHKSGSRLVVSGAPLPLDQAKQFQAYRPTTVKLATGDRLRITANGRTADGKHRLNNGALFTVSGFTPEGNIILENGWQVGREFGHIALGYAVTSWSSQSKTVDKVFIGESRLSAPASGRAGFYVETSRGREKTEIFTDNKQTLREAVAQDRERLTAAEVFSPRPRPVRHRVRQHLSFLRRLASYAWPRERPAPDRPLAKEATYDR
jgi:conjugative relaxase-like TrwC/TraI family protein